MVASGELVVTLATAEVGVPGLNRMKRDILVELGADVVIADYTAQEQLTAWLFGEE